MYLTICKVNLLIDMNIQGNHIDVLSAGGKICKCGVIIKIIEFYTGRIFYVS